MGGLGQASACHCCSASSLAGCDNDATMMRHLCVRGEWERWGPVPFLERWQAVTFHLLNPRDRQLPPPLLSPQEHPNPPSQTLLPTSQEGQRHLSPLTLAGSAGSTAPGATHRKPSTPFCPARDANLSPIWGPRLNRSRMLARCGGAPFSRVPMSVTWRACGRPCANLVEHTCTKRQSKGGAGGWEEQGTGPSNA